MFPRFSLLIALALTVAPVSQAASHWFKGNTHTHTLWSDGNDFPEMIIDWYVSHGYDFLALSDHNLLQSKEVWMSTDAVEKRRKALGKTTMEKYLARFGIPWVETREADGKTEVRLKKMEEYRTLFEKPGKFLIVPAEEVSASFENIPLHMGAVNLQTEFKPLEGSSITDVIRKNLQFVADQEKSTGQPMFVHLNHPNFRWAMTAEDIAEVVEERYFEVYNGHTLTYCNGDKYRAGNEKLWDIANTIRVGKLHAPPLLGVATDDAHNYHGESESPGRGWIMVRADKLEAASLVKAVKNADFYASSGVVLDDVRVADGMLKVVIKGEPGVTYTTRFNGTARDFDPTTTEAKMPTGDPHPVRKNYPADIGKVLATAEGTEVSYQFTGNELFVRATITSSRPHPNPSFGKRVTRTRIKADENEPDITSGEQFEMAWTQPFVPGGKP